LRQQAWSGKYVVGDKWDKNATLNISSRLINDRKETIYNASRR